MNSEWCWKYNINVFVSDEKAIRATIYMQYNDIQPRKLEMPSTFEGARERGGLT